MESKLHKPRKWLAVAGFCLSAAFATFADTETVGDYTWTYHIENGGAVIYKGFESVGEYVLAWSLEGDGVSVAAEGVSQEYASEAEAQSASETLAVAVPREVAAVVADADEYRSYFAKTVRETSPGSGSYVVEATLDPAKVLPQNAEEKAALDGAVLEAALDAEAGETTLTGAKPGLYYSIVADTDLAGSFSTGGEPALCGADGSVTISKPDVSGLNGSAVFFRVKIDAYAR